MYKPGKPALMMLMLAVMSRRLCFSKKCISNQFDDTPAYVLMYNEQTYNVIRL